MNEILSLLSDVELSRMNNAISQMLDPLIDFHASTILSVD